ncbi:MAG: hypothetical protein ACTSRS_09450 [Candidatus Helarchaeota archaeon]
MIVHLAEEALQKCQAEIQDFTNSRSGFKELGGYLMGHYDGNFRVTKFILDHNSEATAVRIKLSADCYRQVEQYLAEHSDSAYIGTWHIHPGKTKPQYSHTDESTLFLEKFVLKTDNPKEFRCPRIHLIFNEDLSRFSAYTLRPHLDYKLTKLWSKSKLIQNSDLTRIDLIVKRLQEVKNELHQYQTTQKSSILDKCFSDLGEIREELDQLIDLVEDTSELQELSQLLKQHQKFIESEIKKNLKAGTEIGILTRSEGPQICLLPYRPDLITQHQEENALIGFWKYFPQPHSPREFQEIFFTNFFLKTNEDTLTPYIYLQSDPSGFTFFSLQFVGYTGYSFEEIEVKFEESM